MPQNVGAWARRIAITCVFLTAGIGLLVEAQSATVSPFEGVGNVQFLDNNAQPLTNGVLYSYAAGTTTQQATYTDASGATVNPDPAPLSSGGRAAVWLLSASTYKLVLCIQNDGPTCAPADVLFSVDNVPGAASGAGGGGGTASLLISGSANPATSGIVRLASSDTICWRNAGGSANLCFSKDANDLFSWSGGSLKFPEVNAPAGVSNFDVLWADNSAHRWMMSNNGGVGTQLVKSGVDVNTSDQVTQLHFGSQATPLSTTVPITGQIPQWTGTNISWTGGGTICTNSTPVTVSNTTSLTNLQSCSIAANTLSAGSFIDINETGVIGSAGVDTLLLTVTIGGSICGIQANLAGANNQTWNAQTKLAVLTNGSSGTANMSCEYFSSPSGGGVTGPIGVVGNPTFPIDTTVSQTIQIKVQRGTASLNNTQTEQLLKAVMYQ